MRPERDALEIRFPRVEGYRVELPEERLTADFNDDSILELTPDLVGPSITRNAGIIGEGVDLSLEHLGDMRPSTLVFHVTQRLLYTKWRDPGEEPKLHLFGQLKRITKQWLDTCLVCKGGTYPALLMYQELADMACKRITAAHHPRSFVGERPIKALLDPYNPTGSTMHVRFNTSKTDRWETDARPLPRQLGRPRQRLGGRVLPRGRSRIPRSGPTSRTTTSAWKCPTATARRRASTCPTSSCWWMTATATTTCCTWSSRSRATAREDAKEKKSTMDTYWVPGVNNLGTYGRWAFAEFTEVYQIEADFEAKVESEFNKMIESVTAQPADARKLTMAKKATERRPSRRSSTTTPSGRTSRPPSTSRC